MFEVVGETVSILTAWSLLSLLYHLEFALFFDIQMSFIITHLRGRQSQARVAHRGIFTGMQEIVFIKGFIGCCSPSTEGAPKIFHQVAQQTVFLKGTLDNVLRLIFSMESVLLHFKDQRHGGRGNKSETD